MFRKKSIEVRGAATRHGDVAVDRPDAGDIIWLDFLQPVANEKPDGDRRLSYRRAFLIS